jgi:hypothetical protein
MFIVFQFFAVLCCMIFAGASIYINLVEHPARMSCGTKTAATVWAPSYKRATVMQAPLAILSFLYGVGAWLVRGGLLWLIGAVLIGLVVPFTFIAVVPTNHHCSFLGVTCLPPKHGRFSTSGRICMPCGARLVFSLPSSIWFL